MTADKPMSDRPDEALNRGGAQDAASGLVGIPGYARGGQVLRTGIALVHEREFIFPAPGSEAVIAPQGEGAAGRAVNYFFPVELDVVGVLDETQLKELASHVFAVLHQEFDSRGLR